MPLIQVYLDDEENEIVEKISKKNNISKSRVIKMIVLEKREEKNG